MIVLHYYPLAPTRRSNDHRRVAISRHVAFNFIVQFSIEETVKRPKSTRLKKIYRIEQRQPCTAKTGNNRQTGLVSGQPTGKGFLEDGG
ncbi:hypothetical protein ACU8OQ_25700 (plasmid) [Rhizobium leguminosarum]